MPVNNKMYQISLTDLLLFYLARKIVDTVLRIVKIAPDVLMVYFPENDERFLSYKGFQIVSTYDNFNIYFVQPNGGFVLSVANLPLSDAYALVNKMIDGAQVLVDENN